MKNSHFTALLVIVLFLLSLMASLTLWAQQSPFPQNSEQRHNPNRPFRNPHPLDSVIQNGFRQVKPSSSTRSRSQAAARTKGSAPWEKLRKPSEGDYLFDLASHNGNLYAASTTGRIYTSSDLAQTWKQVTHVPFYYSNFPHYVDSQPFPNFLTVNDSMIFYKGDYSRDGGETWGNIFINRNSQSYMGLIQGFLVDRNEIYVYTWRHGIYKTTDYGYTWTTLSNGIPHDWYGFVYDVQWMALNHGTLYCQIPTGIYQLNGTTWQPASTVNFYHNNGVDAITIKNMSYQYVETSNGYYFIEPGSGWNWTSLTDIDFSAVPWKPHKIKRMSINEIFAVGSDRKLYHTTNKGMSWTKVDLFDTASYNYTLALSAVGTKVFAGNTFGMFSADSPYQQWTPLNTGMEQSHFVGMEKIQNKLLALSAHHGLYESADDGETWEQLNNELLHTYNSVMLKSGNTLFANNYDLGVMKSTDGGHHWTSIKGFDDLGPAGAKLYQVRLFVTDTSLFITAIYDYGSKIYRSDDEGSSWTTLYSAYSKSNPDSMIYVGAMGADDKSLYISKADYSNYSLIQSNDNGKTWSTVTVNGLPNIVWQGKTYYYPVYDFSFINGTFYGVVGDYPTSDLYKLTADKTEWSKVDVDPSIEEVDYNNGQEARYIHSPQLINNTLVVRVALGYHGPPGFYSPFSPARFEHLFYTSKDNGETWQMADVSTSNEYADIAFLFPYKDKMYSGMTWVGGGLYRTPITAFGIEPALEIYAQSVHGKKGSEVVLPIKVNHFKDILSGQFTVSWDPTVASFAGVQDFGVSGLSDSNFGVTQIDEGILTFSWNEANLIPQSLPDSTTWFSIRMKLSGFYRDSTHVKIIDNPLAVEVVNKDFQEISAETINGVLRIDNLSIVGLIQYGNKSAWPGVNVSLTGSTNLETITAGDGSFNFNLNPQSLMDNYIITPSLVVDNDPVAGIDVADIATLRRHLLQTEILTNPYSILAGDVNKSKSLSTLDIVLMEALILGEIDTWPGTVAWTFAPTDFQFVQNPFVHPNQIQIDLNTGQIGSVDFTGVKIGDVNLSHVSSSSGGRTSSSEEVVFDIHEETIESETDDEKIIVIPIRAQQFADVSAFQFTLTWPKDKLEFMKISGLSTNIKSGLKYVENGELNIIWDSPAGKWSSLNDSDELFALQFKSKNGGDYKNLNVLELNGPLVYNKSLKPVLGVVKWTEGENGGDLSVYPNPFDEKLFIRFYSDGQEPCSLTFRDMTGKVVDYLTINAKRGLNNIAVNSTSLTAGVYVLEIIRGSTIKRQKIIRR